MKEQISLQQNPEGNKDTCMYSPNERHAGVTTVKSSQQTDEARWDFVHGADSPRRSDKLKSRVVRHSLPRWHELRWWMRELWRQKKTCLCVCVCWSLCETDKSLKFWQLPNAWAFLFCFYWSGKVLFWCLQHSCKLLYKNFLQEALFFPLSICLLLGVSVVRSVLRSFDAEVAGSNPSSRKSIMWGGLFFVSMLREEQLKDVEMIVSTNSQLHFTCKLQFLQKLIHLVTFQ